MTGQIYTQQGTTTIKSLDRIASTLQFYSLGGGNIVFKTPITGSFPVLCT